ncbi:TPA: hypothetical protein DCE37_17845 [Candidatus Latescibacteria bacterium]|nr:hypothetical protein [Candidatus Latescibacterota bacterium]
MSILVCGVALAFRMDGSRDVQVNGNTVRNNAGKGIEVADGVEAKLSGNVLRDNGK